ncbi:hypothetical protein H0H92_011446 [Tricholoma furcatifolium]|nr:hypothetical protein H0H92_011446 [Tricholoma furcatifolium]
MTQPPPFQASSIPDAETLSSVSKLEILNSTGEKVAFGSLFESQRTIVVFIRHFFCGMFVEKLAEISDEALETAGTKIVVIGCGDWQPIQSYAGKVMINFTMEPLSKAIALWPETTGFTGPIYADPSRALYHALGMTITNLETTPSGEQRKSYLTKGVLSNAMSSIWNGPLKHPNLIGKQGNISQLGGEFVLGPGTHASSPAPDFFSSFYQV